MWYCYRTYVTMPSTTHGRNLPSICSSDSQKVRPENSRKTSKDLRGRSNAHVEVAGSSQVLAPIRTSVGPRQTRKEERSFQQQQSTCTHPRTSRTMSVSVPDTNWTRNWISEGGRPKRERSLSERVSSERLLRRSLNSVGELIPFQRAPRDGSYESRLPLGKRVAAQRPTKCNSCNESLSLEQRRSARLRESPESCEEQMSNFATSFGKERRQQVTSKGTNGSTLTRNKIPVPRKQNTREVSSRSKSNGPCKIDQRKTLASTKQLAVNTFDTPAITENDCPRTLWHDKSENAHTPQTVLEQDSGENSISQESDTANIQIANFSPVLSNESLIHPSFIKEDLAFNASSRVGSPSAEFKAAAQNSSTGLSTSANSGTPISSHTMQNRTTNNANGEHLHRSHGQPNSVIRRRWNSSGSIDTSQIQSSRAASSENNHRQNAVSQNLDHGAPTSHENLPVEQDFTHSDTDPANVAGSSIASARDDAILERPPAHLTSTNTNQQEATQRARLDRFGRRIRMPSTDSVRLEEDEQPTQDDGHVYEPVREELYEGTNGQRYRSRNSETETNYEVPSLTPNRDLLYGSFSPPARRRLHRARLEAVSSDQGQSAEENGDSVDDPHYHTLSIDNNAELNLAPDSFRNASGTPVAISPILQSGPDTSSSPRVVPRRRLGLGFNSFQISSPSGHLSEPSSQISNLRGTSDVDESSSDDNLHHETLTFSVDEGRISRDSMRRHQADRNEAIPRLLPQRSRQPSNRLSRGMEIMEEVFESTQDRSSDHRMPDEESHLAAATMEFQVPLLGSPLFTPLGISPAVLLGLLIRTRREFGQEFMELLLENMMLNALAHHLFEGSNQYEDGLSGAPPPATQDIIDNLDEIPALEIHIAKEMKCAICHSEYELYEMLTELPCLHFFHPTCVAIWLKKSGTCPVCRFQLSSPTR